MSLIDCSMYVIISRMAPSQCEAGKRTSTKWIVKNKRQISVDDLHYKIGTKSVSHTTVWADICKM
ncbi:hypothetical protein Hanom_Chr01g00062491 [Helianthus anomalus]